MVKKAIATLDNVFGKTENNLRINENPPNKKFGFQKRQSYFKN